MSFPHRRHLLYAALIAAVILLGLATRRRGMLPSTLAKGSGDLLWALCVYLVFGLLSPAAPIQRLAWRAMLFACLIEFALLYHAPWIDAVRRQRLGGLILGRHFHWLNFPYYVAGISLGILGEWSWWRRRAAEEDKRIPDENE